MADGQVDISTLHKAGRPIVVIVTGISGAGKSTALRALEDVGFVAVDNPPLTLASALIADGADGPGLAIGVDIRSRGFSVQAVVDLLRVVSKPLRFDVGRTPCASIQQLLVVAR